MYYLQTYLLQIVFGHSKQLWGLAVHPDDELFATAGYDKNISLWKRHALLWSTQVCIQYQLNNYNYCWLNQI